jgi:hypothetical protein
MCQLRDIPVGFSAQSSWDLAFSVEPQATQALIRRLSARKIDALVGESFARLPHYLIRAARLETDGLAFWSPGRRCLAGRSEG